MSCFLSCERLIFPRTQMHEFPWVQDMGWRMQTWVTASPQNHSSSECLVSRHSCASLGGDSILFSMSSSEVFLNLSHFPALLPPSPAQGVSTSFVQLWIPMVNEKAMQVAEFLVHHKSIFPSWSGQESAEPPQPWLIPNIFVTAVGMFSGCKAIVRIS